MSVSKVTLALAGMLLIAACSTLRLADEGALELTNAQTSIVYVKKVTLQEPVHGGHAAAAAEHTAETVPATAH